MPRGAVGSASERRERHDRDGGLLPLELVDGADRHVGEPGASRASRTLRELRVVGRDDDDVGWPSGRGSGGAEARRRGRVVRGRGRAGESTSRARRRRPLRGLGGVAVVLDRARAQPGRDAVDAPKPGGDGASAAARRRPGAETGAATAGCIRQALREEVAELGRQHVWPSAMSQPRADASTGSGWVPWLTCGSCCGSPSSSSVARPRRSRRSWRRARTGRPRR